MWLLSKLRPETSINILLPAIITLTGLAVLWILVGRVYAWLFVAAVFLIYSLLSFSVFVRTRSAGYLVASLFQLFGFLWIGGAKEGLLYVSDQLLLLGKFGALLFGGWLQILLLTRKMKWRGREILELAALPVEDVTNGFTERPRPVGKVTFSREDVTELARFASKNLIAMPYIEPDRIVLATATMAQSFRHLYPWRRDYSRDTWVSFGSDGQVSVNISQDDYAKYRQSLSFDQLCASLGNLFLEFLEMYRRGEGLQIIDRMNTLRINPYT
ncbi:MAG: hypothetical protein JSW34_00790 [Candidatus Zixiibacteriota bacterium]|nr:MAG: hypothetical protein JSW34_00790 [candidate division Zixibacteria bacterium]